VPVPPEQKNADKPKQRINMQNIASAALKSGFNLPLNAEPTRMHTQEQMYERIMSAVIEHRLPPGTKLGEDQLAELFGVSRAKVRQLLARLAHEGIVTQQPNRGAFVSEPTLAQAREIFELRKLIEPAVVKTVARNADKAVLKRLQAHLARERQAAATGDHRAMIRLTGEFHLLLAELAGNSTTLRVLREMETLTSLVIYLYDGPSMPACRDNDHVEITAAIGKGDATRAAALMLEHLGEVESCLDMQRVPAPEFDLADALGV
jgi:DNA-binding GntR family transcriptional regulator